MTASIPRELQERLVDVPPPSIVLAAHVAHLGQQARTANRYLNAALLADHLATKTPEQCGCTTEQSDEIACQYLAVLNRQDWCGAVHETPNGTTKSSAGSSTTCQHDCICARSLPNGQ